MVFGMNCTQKTQKEEIAGDTITPEQLSELVYKKQVYKCNKTALSWTISATSLRTEKDTSPGGMRLQILIPVSPNHELSCWVPLYLHDIQPENISALVQIVVVKAERDILLCYIMLFCLFVAYQDLPWKKSPRPKLSMSYKRLQDNNSNLL